MDRLILGRDEFHDKVLGCWLGKNIGGTLGAPHEGKKFALGLTFYEPVPTRPLPNDDLDLQLVWVRCLEECGIDPGVDQLADYWNRYADAYPWDEYGFFMRNYHRGLRPPVAGAFENSYVDNMGSPIRSEIWAVLHAGDPDAAARMAWKDSALDHAGGEGTYGEMFWAAAEAAAFVEDDPLTLIRIGLNVIPLSCQIARVIREAVWCHENRLPWGDARERLASIFPSLHPCHAVPNHGFTILGWLYGKDFGDRLLKAVNCGYDTDCTGATLGSILGIIAGARGIPEAWIRPIGQGIITHRFTRIAPPPAADMQELTGQTVRLAEQAAAASAHRGFGPATVRPADLAERLFANDLARAALAQDVQAAVGRAPDGREVWLHYGGEPVLRPGLARRWSVRIAGVAERVELALPAGWTCERRGPADFRVLSAGPVAARNQVEVVLADGARIAFAVLGPDEARGYAANTQVAKCPKCQARIEACLCADAAGQVLQPIRDWHVIGPFRGPEADRIALALPTPIEDAFRRRVDGGVDLDATCIVAGRTLAWKPVRQAVVSLDASLERAEWACAYAYAEIDVPQARDGVLLCGSDDGVRIWLNGAIVHEFDGARSLIPNQDLVPVRLVAGRNRILLKIVNQQGTWGYNLSLVRAATVS